MLIQTHSFSCFICNLWTTNNTVPFLLVPVYLPLLFSLLPLPKNLECTNSNSLYTLVQN